MAAGVTREGGAATVDPILLSPSSRPGSSPALDPIRQIATQLLRSLGSFTIPAGGIVEVATENINRIALLVQSPNADPFVVQPVNVAGYSPLGTVDGSQVPVVIHSAVFPVLCQGRWWAAGNAGVVVNVWEVEQV